jgi:uncharacterized protein
MALEIEEVADKGRRTAINAIASAITLATSSALARNAGTLRAASKWPVWTLERGAKRIYLLGQTPPRADPWHEPGIEKLVRACSVLWTETNDIYREPQKALLERFAVDPKRPLRDWLDRSDMDRLQKAVAYCKVDLAEVEPYRPWCAAAVLQDAYYAASGAKGASADRVLRAQAERTAIPLRSEFPSKDDVFAWFGGMTPTQDVQFLRYTLDEITAGPSANARIYDDWAIGKTGLATAEVERYSRAYPELAATLTRQRNAKWLPRFKSMLDEPGTAFVIVGLYHLVGTDGLLALASGNGMSVSMG